MLVCDGEIAFIGGFNIADEYHILKRKYESTGGDYVGPEQQNILRAAGQKRKASCAIAEQALPRVAREAGKAHDLVGIGDREQHLVGADIHGDDARAGRKCAATRQ